VHSIRKSSAINVLNKTRSLSLAQYHLTHKRATTTDKYLGVTEASALEQLSKILETKKAHPLLSWICFC